jgi:sigma-54 dependent transcriptional regulator, acetoin dehydrogenase operon transcriptional activator AcoR
MSELSALPLDRAAQHDVERSWEITLADGRPAPSVRPTVRDSWGRSLDARIRPDLRHAPLVWQTDDLQRARERTGWLGLAQRAVAVQRGAFATGGHILTLFDRDGRMLHAEGDPQALEGLESINFRPGALWAEHAVGTNGPGTALATGRPAHIVGAEHFCERWQDWHCAAAPIRDQLTGDLQGAIDLSGFRESVHPHTLMLVIAVAVTVEQMLAARDMERRARVLGRFAELAARWPGDALVAVDRAGALLSASPAVPAALHPLAPVPEQLRRALAEIVEGFTSDEPREVWLPGPEAGHAVAHPVFDGQTPVGACLLLPARTRRAATPGLRGRTSSGTTRYALDDLVGESPVLGEAHRVAIAAAANTLPVLITGESGTGKEMFAQGIHAASARSARPFIAVNCAALPAELVESELFGYVGGAFSGARKDGGIGKFEAANGGTIFLDEVGELPLPAQAALLRVLQEGEVTRVGAPRGTPVDVRVIAATNRDIAEALRCGGFRDDLYYRLGVLTIELPALRERRADVERLARRFLAEAETELGRGSYAFAADALDAMRAYAWPGNIRELRNLVWRTVALATCDVITAADLPAPVRSAYASNPTENLRQTGDGAGPDLLLLDPESRAERERVVRAVECAASMSEAAQVLGIARSTLYRQLERYGLQPRRVVRG